MVKTLDETAGAALSLLCIPDSCYSDGRRTRRYVRKKTAAFRLTTCGRHKNPAPSLTDMAALEIPFSQNQRAS